MWKNRLRNKVREYLKNYSATHDYYHAQRVLNYSLKIAKKIKCDKEVLFAAALLHDVGCKNHEKEDHNHSFFGMRLANKWLKTIDFPKKKIDDVVEVIRLHDNCHWEKNRKKVNHIEAMIIQDADRIDLQGAIGALRLTYYFGERGYPIYNSSKPKKTNKVWLNHSLLDQIRRDPITKWENLNFDYSKKISKERNEFLKRFYQELKMELSLHHKIQKEIIKNE